MGGGEVMFELVPLLGRKDFCDGLATVLPHRRCAPLKCSRWIEPPATEGDDGRYILNEQSGPRLAAYAYAHTRSPAFAKKRSTAW